MSKTNTFPTLAIINFDTTRIITLDSKGTFLIQAKLNAKTNRNNQLLSISLVDNKNNVPCVSSKSFVKRKNKKILLHLYKVARVDNIALNLSIINSSCCEIETSNEKLEIVKID